MAIRAHQHALLCFRLVGSEGLASRHRHVEGLPTRFDVMKVQIHHGTVVAADAAAPAGLLNEDLLQPLVAAGDCLANAALAPPPGLADSVEAELCLAVVPAVTKFDGLGPSRIRWSPGVLDEGNRSVWSASRHERMFP
jgi:hypothetical protein